MRQKFDFYEPLPNSVERKKGLCSLNSGYSGMYLICVYATVSSTEVEITIVCGCFLSLALHYEHPKQRNGGDWDLMTILGQLPRDKRNLPIYLGRYDDEVVVAVEACRRSSELCICYTSLDFPQLWTCILFVLDWTTDVSTLPFGQVFAFMATKTPTHAAASSAVSSQNILCAWQPGIISRNLGFVVFQFSTSDSTSQISFIAAVVVSELNPF